MTASDLAASYPKLYHLADKDAFPSILSQGLLSTTALLDLFEVTGKRRHRFESAHRPRSHTLDHPDYGSAVIRDQKPLHPSKLDRCLDGCSQAAWFECLNRKVFFWTDYSRVQRLFNARAYRADEQLIVTLDTASLLGVHEDSVVLCHKNSGQTRAIHPLGPQVFVRINDWPDKRRRDGSLARSVVEFCVDYAVADVVSHLLRAEVRKGNNVLRVLWPQEGSAPS